MATTILIICPECGKQIKAPDNVLGKRVRCKFCQAAFVASKGGNKPAGSKPGKPAAVKSAKTSPGKPAAGKPRKSAVEDDEDDDNPYELTDVSLAPRCPNCANEMEDEEAIICLTCGYNTRTRELAKMVKTYDTTFGDYFLWLLPGIACALAVLILIGFNVVYLWKIDDWVDWDKDSFFLGMWTISGIKLWVVIMSLGLIWLAGKFAVKRLILHYTPPEVEKLK